MSKKIEARKINYECKCIPFYELEQENVRLKMQLQIINDEMRDNGFLSAEKSKKIGDLQLENESLKEKLKQYLDKITKLINEDMSTIACEHCTKNNDECSRCFKTVVENINKVIDEVENEI